VKLRLSPRAFDIALAATFVVFSVAEALTTDAGVHGPRGASAAAGAAMSLVVLWRRTRPVAAAVVLVVLVIPAAAFLIDPSEAVSAFFPLLVLGYSGGAYAEQRDAGIVLGLLLTGIVGVALVDQSSDAGDFYFPSAVLLLTWLGGRTVRTRGRHAAELHELAAMAAERREHEAHRAVADERRRIAREMHDVVAHSISLMVVQAGGARRILATDPARAEQAAARIRRAGSDALAEMDILLGVLETSQGSPPTLDGLPDLVEQAQEAGLPVTLEVTGTRTALPAGAELAVYRVVQEALTNAVKHAGGANTHVELAWGEDTLEVRVADRGDGGLRPGLAGAGHGLIGMRERIRVHGGDVEAGPRGGGGFEVLARLPLGHREASVR
jgi:signal transduction histidine kinase